MPPERAALLGWTLCGIVNAVTGFAILDERAAWRRVVALLFDLGHFIALGLIALVATWVWMRIQPSRAWLKYPALFGLSGLLGAWTLATDLEPMAERVGGDLPLSLVLTGLVAVVAVFVPLAHAVGIIFRLAPARLEQPLRGAAVVLGLGAQAANPFVLINDYPAAHLYLAWCAATLVATALAGWSGGDWLAERWEGITAHRGARVVGMALPRALAVASVLIVPPATVSSLLLRHSGSVLPPYLAPLRPKPIAAELTGSAGSDWFSSRAGVSSIPPSKPSLLAESSAVIVLSIDALRADVANDGEHDAAIPTIAMLRDQGTSFDHARAPGTKTVYTVTSLFAGTYFSQQYWSVNRTLRGKRSLWPHADDTKRFPAQLGDAGVFTLNVSASDWMVNEWGVVRGFEKEMYVKDGSTYAHADSVMNRLMQELDAAPADQHLFVWTHLLDAHAPYNLGGKQGTDFERHLAELTIIDTQIARLVEHVKKGPRADRTIFVITSDHGEAFGEHNSEKHGTTVYDEVMRVPLIFAGPEIPVRRVDEYVSLIDLGPTLLDLYGAPTPGHNMGQSLVGYFRGESPELTRPIVCETRLKRAMLFDDGIKVIIDDRNKTTEIYDLKADPLELDNLADDPALSADRVGTMERFFDVHRIQRPGYEVPWRP